MVNGTLNINVSYRFLQKEKNDARVKDGLKPLPEEDVSKIFKDFAPVGRLESLLSSNRVSSRTKWNFRPKILRSRVSCAFKTFKLSVWLFGFTKYRIPIIDSTDADARFTSLQVYNNQNHNIACKVRAIDRSGHNTIYSLL